MENSFMEKVEFWKGDNAFAYRVERLMELENIAVIKEWKKEEDERQLERRKEVENKKNSICTGCKEGKLFFSCCNYPLYGIHIEFSCDKCSYVEVF